MENQLTLADMASIKSLIEAACNRGAFKANEMRAIGEIYDKLAKFVDAHVSQAPAQATPSGEENA